uniref:Uncharacterized protein n=1 Tax=uncultured Armatimonadetes bacterium TaxID=157466 RepID=A0A6J4J6X4_9BACT|nr:hypothetical protein AVDCRST_MAG63-2946 [uncultured Armatimonadetes bacterium]
MFVIFISSSRAAVAAHLPDVGSVGAPDQAAGMRSGRPCSPWRTAAGARQVGLR